MKLTWVIIRKDLYRLRWALALWLLVMLARDGFAVIQGSLDEVEYYPFNRAAWLFGSVFSPVIAFGLVMGLQDDDPLADSEAFWITRPISGIRLLAAKSLTFLILLAFPVLITAPFWLYQGYDLGQLASASTETIKVQFFVTLAAVPFATISPNGPRFLINVFLAAVAIATLGLIYRLVGIDHSGAVSRGVWESRLLIITVLWGFSSSIVILVQFLFRRTRYSVAVISAALLGGFSVASLWTRDIAPKDQVIANRPPETSELQFKSVKYYANTGGNWTAGPTLRMEYEINGVRNGAIASPNAVTHHLQWPDGGALLANDKPAFGERVRLFWPIALGNVTEPRIHADIKLPLNSDGDQLFRSSAIYSATITGEINYPAIAVTVGAQAGEKSVRKGMVVEVISVVSTLIPKGPPVLEISLSESAPYFPDSLSQYVFVAPHEADSSAYYYLVNREDGRSLLARVSRTGELLYSSTSGYFRTTLAFLPDPAHAWNGDAPADAMAWAKKATLVKVIANGSGNIFQYHQSEISLEANMIGWHFRP